MQFSKTIAPHKSTLPVDLRPRVWRAVLFLVFFMGVFLHLGVAQEGPDLIDEPESLRVPRIGVARVFGGDEDARLSAVAESLTDTVELNLRLLGRYEVHRLDAPELAVGDIQGQTAWAAEVAAEELLDYVLLGTATADELAISIELSIFDRQEDARTVDAAERVESIFDLFDAADEVTTTLLSAFSGEIIVFGTLSIQPDRPGSYTVLIDGAEIGVNIREQRVLAGNRVIEITQDRIFDTYIIHSETVSVQEARTEPVRFEIPLLHPDESAAIAEIENEIDELWNLPNAQFQVERSFEELEELLSDTPFAPELSGELQRVREVRQAYAQHAAAGFPFDPERVRLVASFDRLSTSYGFMDPGAQEVPEVSRPGFLNRLDIFSAGSPTRLRLGGGIALGSDYKIPGVSSGAGENLDGLGSFAGVGLEFAPGSGIFHGLMNLESGSGGDNVSILEAGDEPISYRYGYAGLGLGVNYEVLNRLGVLVDLEYGLQMIRYDLGNDESGSVTTDPADGRVALRTGLRFAVSPRFDAQIAYEVQPRGVLRHTLGVSIVSRIGPVRDRRSNPALDRDIPFEYAVAMNEAGADYLHERYISAYYGYRQALSLAETVEQEAFAQAALARARYEYEAQLVGRSFEGIETTLQHYLALRELDRDLALELNYLVRAEPDSEDEELRRLRQAVRWFE